MLVNIKKKNRQAKLDYTRLLPRALRAIRYANVRFGILPAQSRFRGNDEQVEFPLSRGMTMQGRIPAARE